MLPSTLNPPADSGIPENQFKTTRKSEHVEEDFLLADVALALAATVSADIPIPPAIHA
jgi:hypothetical protein